MKREKPPLYDMEFVILGYTKDEKDELKSKITKLGGKVVTKISRSVMAVIARESDVENNSSRVEQAQVEDVHVVSKDFVDEAKENSGKIPDLVIKKSICSWGSDVRKTFTYFSNNFYLIDYCSRHFVCRQRPLKAANRNHAVCLQVVCPANKN